MPIVDSLPWAHFNTESKAHWYTISDGLPQFATVPDPEQWKALSRSHRR